MPLLDNFFVRQIALKNRSMMDVDEALNLYYALSSVLSLPGDVVELGCYRGLTSILLQKTIEAHTSTATLFVYDSFEGLPEKSIFDEVGPEASMRIKKDNKKIGKGWFTTSIEDLKGNFSLFKTKLPIICPGWFSETLPHMLPEKIVFAHVDGDFYSSVFASLEAVYPRMVAGGIIIIDDYCDPSFHENLNAYPGVKRACDAFLKDKQEIVQLLASKNGYQGFIIKQNLS